LNMRDATPSLPSLDLAGDGDDLELIRAIELSFRLDFADSTLEWRTVGDVERAVLAAFGAGETPGKCATSMAFYRLRAALPASAVSSRPHPATRLRDLELGRSKAAFRAMARRTGFQLPGLQLSGVGAAGLVAIGLGLIGLLALGAAPQLWPVLPAIPAGVLLISLDPLDFGDMTLGDLSREVAARNFAALAKAGADRRPGAIWDTLRVLIAVVAEAPAPRIARTTRLMA